MYVASCCGAGSQFTSLLQTTFNLRMFCTQRLRQQPPLSAQYLEALIVLSQDIYFRDKLPVGVLQCVNPFHSSMRL